MSLNPRISVVTISFNAVGTIEKTIRSVISQNYPNLEYIVIDGGSKDGTVDIIKKYSDNISLWVSEKDKGIYDAMNKGFAKANGEWIMYVNSGDVLHDDNALRNLVNVNHIDQYDIIYGDSVAIYDDDRRVLRKATDSIPSFREIPSFRHGAAIMKIASMPNPPFEIDRKEFGFALDTNLIFKLIHNGGHFRHVNNSILDYEKEGTSNNQLAIAKYNYKIFTQYGFKLIPFIQYIKSLVFQTIKNICA